MHAKRNRIYPDIHLGDHVKIYTKKKKYDKEHEYDVEDITISHGQTFYKTSFGNRPFMRHEILKVAS